MKQVLGVAIFIAILAVVLYYLLKYFSANATKSSTVQVPLVNNQPEAGMTTANTFIEQTSGTIDYILTFTPSGFVASKAPLDSLPISKNITADGYNKFITKYPNGKAEGNVMADFV